jgi:hypothetical protein
MLAPGWWGSPARWAGGWLPPIWGAMGKRNTKKKSHQKPYFVQLLYGVIDSEAFWNLSRSARDIFLLFKREYNGFNGDRLILPYGTAKRVIGIAPATYCKGIKELVDAGFLDIVRSGGLNMGKGKNPSIYAFSERYKEKSTFWWSWKKKPPEKIHK